MCSLLNMGISYDSYVTSSSQDLKHRHVATYSDPCVQNTPNQALMIVCVNMCHVGHGLANHPAKLLERLGLD